MVMVSPVVAQELRDFTRFPQTVSSKSNSFALATSSLRLHLRLWVRSRLRRPNKPSIAIIVHATANGSHAKDRVYGT